jgi:protein ImuB
MDLWRDDADAPRAIVDGERPPRVRHASAAARAFGVKRGMSVAAAYALCGALVVRPYDPAPVREALEGLALRLARYTPTLCLDVARDALLLEVSGSLRLFGGLAKLRAALREDLRELAYVHRIGGAPTPEGAMLLASGVASSCGSDVSRDLSHAGAEDRDSRRSHMVASDAASAWKLLSSAPVAKLPLAPGQREQLTRVGLRTLGEIARLPRDALARRCGAALVEWLDRVRGAKPDPRAAYQPPEAFMRKIELFAPVEGVDALVFGVRRLVGELAGWLSLRGGGAQRLVLSLAHERRAASEVPLALARASRDGAHLFALLRERLEHVRLPAPVAAIAIALDAWQRTRTESRALFADPAQEAENAATLIERLRARLGDEAVGGIAVNGEHRPGLAQSTTALPVAASVVGAALAATGVPRRNGAGKAPLPNPPLQSRGGREIAARPAWLLRVPQPLHEQHGRPQYRGALTFISGPERVESGWWDDDDQRRDYFLAENPLGQRLWIFRTREDAHWYLHGLFG